MAPKRAFISFDYDSDLALKDLMAGQAKFRDGELVDAGGGATKQLGARSGGSNQAPRNPQQRRRLD